jgi:ATP-dependent Clp protease ATP-binding subunit ClpB
MRKGERVTSASAEETYNSLNKYAEPQRNGKSRKLDPVIGRDEEIRRVLQIPVGLKQPYACGRRVEKQPLPKVCPSIVDGDVPDLKDKIVFSLDMGALIAGNTKENLKNVLNQW